MINIITKENGKIVVEPDVKVLPDSLNNLLWIDLLSPSKEEKALIEKVMEIELFTRQESKEIESSSRYLENEEEVGINLNFLKRNIEGGFANEPVSFILKNNILITQRSGEYNTFTDTLKKINIFKPKTGANIMLTLFETRIDFDADLIENITDHITGISRDLVKDKDLERDLLIRITSLQETTIAIRENIVEKQRILSSILKSRFFPKDDYETIRVMIKDVGSLLDHTAFSFERLEFLQNTFLGLVDMEQNRIIKIFTVVTVVFMPPTLIASMYGMNFVFMPELDEVWGYPFAILLMILSSAATLLFFRRKKWL
ncbi:magnesium/cobalt transporter CorA [Fulvivirga sp. 29W222]|uniref:Magnesium transport protein CorA n=1 Tax=Fulvivirga marina TaxID=2494733 RepID=A0A937G5L8_9BACT|nr:magnesium/cobalt transporter CorA [Fulvivirga marina]MBL6448856.1 magnesium/cobalt transporter CorA [Fulvivirga marina]